MFTGIVQAVGRITRIQMTKGDKRFFIETGKLDLSDVVIGDSIAVNGVCLTVAQLSKTGFDADVSIETLNSSSLSLWKENQLVNLEKSLTPTSSMGGHWVAGHVDGFGQVVSVEPSARSNVYWIKAQENIARFIASKGSITVDGVSLTVNDVQNNQFSINIVPHTQKETIINTYKIGTDVNLEVDILSRYVERLLNFSAQKDQDSSNITEDFLKNHGFMR